MVYFYSSINSSDKYIRDYIAERCRILAVVGLHGNAFKPHTGTKTSVLFVQKWTDENCGFPNICPKKDDYPIFFATMQEPSKDNSGEKIYVTENYVTWIKFNYRIENGKIISIPDEQQTPYGDTKFVKDLFIEDNGNLENHKKWIFKPVSFELKKAKAKNEKEKISIDEYLNLSSEKKKKYKEVVNVNDCEVYSDDEIDLGTYNSFSKEKQKLCLPLETVTEFTEKVKDTHGHIFVKHDLFNHDKSLDELWKNRDERLKGRYSKDGIAEAFQEFAKKEGLSFFQ